MLVQEGERPVRGGTGPETEERRWKKMRAAERALPRLRRQVRKDLATGPSERACLAGAVVLLDRAAMRVGSETYAQAHGTYGAASLLRKHATVDGSKVRLEFKGKSGVQWRTDVQDAAFARLVGALQAQPLDEDAPLFSYPSPQGYRAINAGGVNEYLKVVSGDRGLSAKGLRTYHASRMLEDKLQEEGMPEEPKRREGALRRAVKAVAAKLHHTVAVCRSTYLHPGIIQAYLDGRPEFATLLKADVGEDGYTEGERRFNALLDALERAGYAGGGGGGNSSSQRVGTQLSRGGNPSSQGGGNSSSQGGGYPGTHPGDNSAIEKGGYPAGTVRVWGDGKSYKKRGDRSWTRIPEQNQLLTMMGATGTAPQAAAVTTEQRENQREKERGKLLRRLREAAKERVEQPRREARGRTLVMTTPGKTAREIVVEGGGEGLAYFVTPQTGNSVRRVVESGRAWAADNAAFSSWDAAKFARFTRRIADEVARDGYHNPPLFVAAPDVVGDHGATLERFWEYQHELGVTREGLGLPLAFVVQNGAEDEYLQTSTEDAGEHTAGIPWDHIDAVFVGGDTEWKLSEAATRIIREAKARGKWVHVGRVNSDTRLAFAAKAGADSIDGSSTSRFPRAHIPPRLASAGKYRAGQRSLYDAPAASAQQELGLLPPMRKARGYAAGTVRQWADGKHHRKQADGTWVEVADPGQRSLFDLPATKVEETAGERYKRLQTRSPEFKAWFGDWEKYGVESSRVIKPDGEPAETYPVEAEKRRRIAGGKPIVAYHGTARGGFRTFDPEKQDAGALYGPGFYFTEDRSVAEEYEEKGATLRVPVGDLGGLGERLEQELSRFPGYGRFPDLREAVVGYTQAALQHGPESRQAQDAFSDLTAEAAIAEYHVDNKGIEDAVKRHFCTTKGLFAVYLNIRNPFDGDVGEVDRRALMKSRPVRREAKTQLLGKVAFLSAARASFDEVAQALGVSKYAVRDNCMHNGENVRVRNLLMGLNDRTFNADLAESLGISPEKLQEGATKLLFRGWARQDRGDYSAQSMQAILGGIPLHKVMEAAPEAPVPDEVREKGEFFGPHTVELFRQLDKPAQERVAVRWAENLEKEVDRALGAGARDVLDYDRLVTMIGAKLAVAAALQEMGYDGITHMGGRIMGDRPHRVWIAFKPEQIKAVGNEGTFDPVDSDIYKALQRLKERGGPVVRKARGAPPGTVHQWADGPHRKLGPGSTPPERAWLRSRWRMC